MGQSLKEYITSLGHLGWVVLVDVIGGLAGAYLDITGKLGFPTWLWGLMLGIALIVVPFMAFHRIRVQLDKYRGRIRLNARIGNTSVQHGGNDKNAELDITTTINFEIWTDVDIHTSSLVLNVVGIRDKKLWQFWKWFLPRTQRLFGMPISNQGNTIYRKHIKHADPQPYTDNVTFRWKGKRRPGYWYSRGWNLNEGFYFELALETGSPGGVWRAVTSLQLYGRGVTNPL